MESKSTLRRCVISNISKEDTEAILQLVQAFLSFVCFFYAKEQEKCRKYNFQWFNRHFKEVELTK